MSAVSDIPATEACVVVPVVVKSVVVKIGSGHAAAGIGHLAVGGP